MERSLSSLTFEGSIPEAIAEAKNQKKLFVVYISGENTESVNLESTTWTDLKVAESLSKYCILLHISEGSSDAANFCAIYPQKSIPCITAIGYNGVQLWKSEGFISAEDLASSLEKAWLSLHIQETTATVLTAALASKKSEPPTSGTSVIGSSEQGSSSGTAVPSSSSQKHVQSSEAGSSVRIEMSKETNTELSVKASSTVVTDGTSGSAKDEDSNSSSKATKDSLSTTMANPESSRAAYGSFSAADSSVGPQPEGNIFHSAVPKVGSGVISSEVKEAVQYEKADERDDHGTLGNCDRVSELSEVHLNIRLPDGNSLQEKFSVTSSLRIVKDYVDRNQASGLGSYDLAVPYPRKVFSDEDLNKSLSELSLFNRQALIVIPRQKRTLGYRGGESSSFAQTISISNAESSNGSGGGYFSFIKTILSYANPFSYFSSGVSSSGSGQGSQTGMWEYGPNPALGNSLAGRERNDNTSSSRNVSKSRPLTTSHFGSNIHTLRHDEEDDGRFSDRNAFWNGNSTQYGGDSNGR